MKKILEVLNLNHWYIVGIALGVIFLLWLYGCESTTVSLIDPEKKVNRYELRAEADLLVARIENKFSDLDRQDEIKQLLLDQAAIFGQTGQFNPTGLLNAFISIGAISFGLNQRTKRLVLEKKTNSV